MTSTRSLPSPAHAAAGVLGRGFAVLIVSAHWPQCGPGSRAWDLSGTGEPVHGVEQLAALFGGHILVAGGQGAGDAMG